MLAQGRPITFHFSPFTLPYLCMRFCQSSLRLKAALNEIRRWLVLGYRSGEGWRVRVSRPRTTQQARAVWRPAFSNPAANPATVLLELAGVHPDRQTCGVHVLAQR